MKKIIFLLALCLVFAGVFLDANPLEEARRAEKRGDREAAFSAYSRWMERESVLDNQVELLFHAIELVSDVNRIRTFLERSLPKLRIPSNRSRVWAQIASLWERLGVFESAEQAYKAAYRENPTPSNLAFLFRSAQLLFELGNFEESERQIRNIHTQSNDPLERWEAQFLLARIYSVTNRLSEAVTVGEQLLKETELLKIDPSPLVYFLYTVTEALGNRAEQDKFASTLRKSSPLLVKFLDEQGSIEPLPLPSLFLTPIRPSSAAPRPAPRPSAAAEPFGVQVGSFSMRENADYLARDLQKLGFSVLIKQGQRKDGSPVYRAIVPIQGANPQTVLIRLRELGYIGVYFYKTEND